MTYAEAVKKLRTTLILSQTELANLLCVSFQTVNCWERGTHKPTNKSKRKFAPYFKKHKIEVDE